MQPHESRLEFLDDLSGVYNRRYLRHLKDEVISTLLMAKTPFSLSIVDIDHFKEVNDTYGHMKGDEVIADFARFLRETLRPEDVIIRYGGDEFLIIQEGLNGENAFAVWDNIVSRVSKEKFGGLGITISAGLATYPEDGASYEELFLKADERLYLAKRTGRDRVGREALKKVRIPPKDFVNRKKEADALRGAVMDGEIALVVGEAGIGKTRLIREVLRKFDNTEVLWSDCIAIDSKLPYYPLRELVKYKISREGLDVFRDMPLALKIEIGKIVPEIIKEVKEDELKSLGASVDKYRLYEAFTYVFNAGRKRKVIVIDNIQWIDSDSVDALKYILLSSKGNLGFVLAQRTGGQVPYLERFINGIQRTYPLRKIELLPLEKEHVRSFVRTIIGDNVQDLEEYVIPRSGGNPFYIEELVKILNRESYLKVESGKWVFSEPDSELLPGGIEGVIKEKFAGLSHDAKEVVKVVSVAGKGYIELLKNILDYNEGRIFGAVEEGIRSTLLRESEEGEVIEFRYGVARHVIYNTELNNITRTHLHKKIAEWLELNMGTEAAEEIAYHYYLAGVKDKIIEYGERAGDKASELYAEEKALNYYEWVEDKLKEDGDNAETSKDYARILVKKAGLLRRLGNLLQAEEFLRKAMEFAKNVGIPEIEKVANSLMSSILWNLGKFTATLDSITDNNIILADDKPVEKETSVSHSVLSDTIKGISKTIKRFDDSQGISRKIKQKLKDSKVEESRVTQEASSYYKKAKGLFGKYAKRLQDMMKSDEGKGTSGKIQVSYKEGAGIALHLGYRLGEDLTLDNIAVLLAVKGDFDNAEKYLLSSLRERESGGDLKTLSFIHNNLGLVYRSKGRLKDALKHLIEADKMAERIVDKAGEAIYKTNIGTLLTVMGSYSTAMNILEDAYDIAERIEMREVLAEIIRNTLRVYISEGDHRKALLILAEIEEDGAEDFNERDFLLIKAEVLLQNGELEEASNVLKKLDRILPDKIAPPLKIEKILLEIKYALLTSDYETAKTLLDDLYYLLKSYPDKLYFADYYRLMGIAYCPSNKVKSLKLFNMAKELYENMELKHKVKNIEEDLKRCYSAS